MTVHAPHELRTETEFTLGKGYLDPAGVLHRHGTMRLATAADEILPQCDPRVRANEAYLSIIVLARVVTRLGQVEDIDVKVIERLFAADYDQLQRLYEEFNASDDERPPATPSANPGRADPAGGGPVLGEA